RLRGDWTAAPSPRRSRPVTCLTRGHEPIPTRSPLAHELAHTPLAALRAGAPAALRAGAAHVPRRVRAETGLPQPAPPRRSPAVAGFDRSPAGNCRSVRARDTGARDGDAARALVRRAPVLVLPLAGFLALTLSGHSATGVTTATARTARAAVPAARIFLRDCAVCHGADARGTNRGPSLAHEGTASLDYWISTGRMPLSSPGAAPSRGTPKYPRRTIDALVRYVQSIDGGGGPSIPVVNLATANVAAGGELFRLNCAACHSWAGGGGALTARAAPSTHQATATQIAEAIRVGPGRM